MNFITRSFVFILLQSGTGKCVEWRSTEMSVDSETHDQKWAVVIVVGYKILY